MASKVGWRINKLPKFFFEKKKTSKYDDSQISKNYFYDQSKSN